MRFYIFCCGVCLIYTSVCSIYPNNMNMVLVISNWDYYGNPNREVRENNSISNIAANSQLVAAKAKEPVPAEEQEHRIIQ